MNKKISSYNSIKIGIVLIMLFSVSTHKIVAQQYTEYEVKAAYIYNFINFTQWPNSAYENSQSEFVIGIYGYDPFRGLLNEIFRGKQLQNRNWKIVHFKTPEEITKCHLLFLSDVNPSELDLIFEKIEGKPVLSVGNDIERFCDLGGIINFTEQNAKHRFEINNNHAVNINLKISSKLLFLAKIISEDENRF
ncbi:MAG TPA: hypothetical protein DDX39_11255 [Bacteroidales bacterium]|nr:MAG: hypothetical protein A2W98_13850 [Bacteroidetes bacterium GWF2_33_38]OFY74318.1 MAG: hypothetical protein A2265_05540 [Bacteroidetes bacterium RIFOXYA12_FULL_33_9]OFY90991.1 MAG: hypothetical protein A2236_03485 [Bacteroidetes bacterium RIFOXYA2_FULL_33_7]HBF89208.1 hypothetical protein [Bacteroidales bacterium]